MSRSGLGVGMLACSVLLPVRAAEQPREASVVGYVLSPSGEAIEGATVGTPTNDGRGGATSDGRGWFDLGALPSGVRVITVRAPQHATLYQRVELEAGEHASLTLELEAEQPEPASDDARLVEASLAEKACTLVDGVDDGSERRARNGDPACVDALLGPEVLFGEDGDEACWLLLDAERSAELLAALREGLKDEAAGVRVRAVTLLVELTDDEDLRIRILDVLESALPHLDLRTRWVLYETASDWSDYEPVWLDLMLSGLTDPAPPIRMLAATFLGEAQTLPRHAHVELAQLAGDLLEVPYRIEERMAGTCPYGTYSDCLSAHWIAETKPARTALTALLGLGDAGRSLAISIYIEALIDPEPQLRERVRYELVHVDGEVKGALRDALPELEIPKATYTCGR